MRKHIHTYLYIMSVYVCVCVWLCSYIMGARLDTYLLQCIYQLVGMQQGRLYCIHTHGANKHYCMEITFCWKFCRCAERGHISSKSAKHYYGTCLRCVYLCFLLSLSCSHVGAVYYFGWMLPRSCACAIHFVNIASIWKTMLSWSCQWSSTSECSYTLPCIQKHSSLNSDHLYFYQNPWH